MFQRFMTFLDEWLLYLLLVIFFIKELYVGLVLAAVVGVPLIIFSYKKQWALEKSRFDDEEKS
ncbi:MAG: hypothetical protein ACTSYO_07995 [Candidatus Ranarchaeia archaeon]